jgi:hypothetical protein
VTISDLIRRQALIRFDAVHVQVGDAAFAAVRLLKALVFERAGEIHRRASVVDASLDAGAVETVITFRIVITTLGRRLVTAIGTGVSRCIACVVHVRRSYLGISGIRRIMAAIFMVRRATVLYGVGVVIATAEQSDH